MGQAAEERVVEELAGVGCAGVWVVCAVVSLSIVQVAASSVDVGCDGLVDRVLLDAHRDDWRRTTLDASTSDEARE